MAGETAESKIPIFLGFKMKEDTFQVFQVYNWKVRTLNTIKYLDGKVACDCAMFKFEGNCGHHDVITKEVEKWAYGKDDYRSSDVVLNWHEEAARLRIACYDQTSRQIGLIHPTVGDLSLNNLTWLLTQRETTDSIRAATGALNPHRIFKELTTANARNCGIADKLVTAAGEGVPTPEEAKITPEDKFIAEEFAAPEESSTEKVIHLKDEVEDIFGEVKPPVPLEAIKSTVPEEIKTTKKERAREAVREGLKKKDEARKVVPKWKEVMRPHPGDFYVSKDDWHNVCFSIVQGDNLLLTGPTGCGKSELLYRAAQRLGIHLEPFNMGAMSEARTALIGNVGFSKEDGTRFTPSRFVRATRGDMGPAMILLDEITRSSRDASNILLPLLDRQAYLALDESEEEETVIKRADTTTYAATANIGMEYTGADALDIALKNRFLTVLDLTFPPADNEVTIIMTRCPGIERKNATRLVRIANNQRSLAVNDGEFVEQISTRMLLSAGDKIANGFPIEIACKYSIENSYSAEGGDSSERTKIKQIIQKGG